MSHYGEKQIPWVAAYEVREMPTSTAMIVDFIEKVSVCDDLAYFLCTLLNTQNDVLHAE